MKVISGREIDFNMDVHVPGKFVKYRCYILLGLLTCVYILTNSPVGSLSVSFVVSYVVLPLSWGAVVYFIWWQPRAPKAGRLRLLNLINWLALVCAGFYIIFLLAGGMIDGFGKSPSSFTVFGIFSNIIYVGSSLAGTEFSRAFLINNLSRRRTYAVLGFFSLFFTFIGLPLTKITSLQGGFETSQFAGSFFFPALAENIFASYLAYMGGALPTLIYRGVLQIFQWFCPYLPDLNWTTKAFIGTLTPVLSLLMVHRLYMAESKELNKRKQNNENPVSWIITSVASVLLVWFCVGNFSIFPSVILSGSMMPGIKIGDVVLVKRMSGEEAQLGDIIQFRQEKIYITHRVVEINGDDEIKLYRTKGDANDANDPDPVTPQQIAGKVIYVVPKIGWATMIMRGIKGGFPGGRGTPSQS